jgi:hypothetical protein
MIRKTIPLILHPHFTKISSFFIGYMLWAFVAQFQLTTTNKVVPICFYQNSDQSINRTIIAPDSAMISITGNRKDIYEFNSSQSAIHLDLSQYCDGDHEIQLVRENLFLPDSLKLVHLVPAHISIKISSNKINEKLSE